MSIEKPICLGGSSGVHLAVKISKILNLEYGEIEVKSFPDGEIYVRIIPEVENRNIIYVNSLALKPNQNLIETLLTIETLRDLGARRILAIIPYMAYARQDSRFKPGEAISIEIVAKFLSRIGIDEIITVDMHLHRIEDPQKIFKIPIHNITAMHEIAKYIRANYKLENPIVIGPDEEAEQWAKIVAGDLGLEYDVLEKERISGEKVIVKTRELNVRGRDIIVVDDIISTGGTVVETVKALRKLGARRFLVACTHPLLVKNAYNRIVSLGVEDIIGTDTVLSPISKVSVAPVIAEYITSHIKGVSKR